MLSFRYCAMFLEGGIAEPGSASNLLPGIVPKPQTLLAPRFPLCSALYLPWLRAHLSMGYGRGGIGFLQSLKFRGLHPTILRLVLPLLIGTDGAAPVTSIPEPSQ